jgi:putative nucleotidyltransferase with HDIG domain
MLQGKSDVCTLEFRIITRNNEERWIGHTCQGVYGRSGAFLGQRGSNRDITDRKKTAEELKEKDKFLESIIQSSAVATFVVNAEHKVIYWNRACEDLTGMKSENLLGTSDHWKAFYDHPRPCVADVIIDNKINEMTNIYKVYAKSVLIPDGIRTEGWYPNLGGKNRYVVFDAAPIRDENGKLIAAIETLQDITDRNQAEEKLKDTLESLRKAVGTTIQVMVSAVEARDPYTSGHQIRSANLARTIATEMGLSQEKIEGIRMAGSIHDIGKLSIPAEILSKPTKLSELEFSLIKEHAQQGYEMLKNVESPWPLAEIVYQHHERMDGSGYPRNLKGDEILMEARIMAVADVVEAMASHRPYRPALGIDAALAEIQKNRGTLYDNTVVDACLKLFRENGFKLEVT